MMNIKFRFFIFILLSFSSCTNRFNIDATLANQLASISLDFPEETIEAYELQNHLQKILNTGLQGKKYRLEIRVNKTSSDSVVQKDSEVLRQNVEFNVWYQLYKLDDSNPIYKGKFRQISSFNTSFSPYSTNVEYEAAKISLARSCAEELRRKLILFFKRTNL